eukprot:m.155089 g.155089  ORF g.155089 m.155089 type:complete len:258 (+) comp14394_c0_seq2:213-986(+)
MIPSHPHLPRGNSKVDQNNKKYVKQWLKRLGVPTVIYSKMLIGPMNEVYNDTSDMKINKLLQSIPPKDIAATLERVQKDMEAEELKKSGNLPEKRKREKKSEPTTKPELKESAGEDPFEMPFRLPKLLKRGGRQETPSSNGKLLLPRLDYGKCYRCDRDFGSLLEQMRHEYGMHKFIDAGLIRRADGAALTCFPCEPPRLLFWFAAVRAGGPRVLSVATCPLCHIATCFLCFPHAISHVLMSLLDSAPYRFRRFLWG